MLRTFVCQNKKCNKEFESSCEAPKYCSVTCKHVGQRKWVDAVCVECSQPFVTGIRGAHCKRCPECASHYRDKIEVECQVCHKKFLVIKSKVKIGAGKYCSRTCKHIGITKLVQRECLSCHEPFLVSPVYLERDGGKYCSVDCYKRSKAILPSSLEIILYQSLDNLGVPYSTQKQFGRYAADAFIEPNLVLEADGNYWHTTEDAIEKDKRRDKWFADNGYIVMRFTEYQLRKMPGIVTRAVRLRLNSLGLHTPATSIERPIDQRYQCLP